MIDHLMKVLAKYERQARELRDKLQKLIDELRKLKNKLVTVRQETIRLHEEIHKLRQELHRLHVIYHQEWLELQRLDKEYYKKSKACHDDLPVRRKELSDLLDSITACMRAVPYQFMNGDALD